MMALRRLGASGVLVCLGLVPVSCERAANVPIENVQVTPVTGADIQRAVHDSGAKAVLVNVWATWCAPCREEFPGLVRVARQYQAQGLKVMLVSADDDSDVAPVKKFLAAAGVDFPAYIKAQKDQAFIDTLNQQSPLDKQWDGALPATFIYDGSGKLHDFWEGEVTFNVFQQKVVEVLGKQAKPTGGTS